ncbi:hypothetical protein WMY93_028045 [Mugilogobius chulae]|uniref:CHHC U11-48K-type domain-containing protein n=1 Tax=Mugilogobius chulae TaxID=88201 RepID=A0AAW0N6J1_9GOBI
MMEVGGFPVAMVTAQTEQRGEESSKLVLCVPRSRPTKSLHSSLCCSENTDLTQGRLLIENTMAVEGCLKFVKYLVFFFNFIFWLCGMALIVVGVMVQVSLHNTVMIKDASASGAPILIISLGVIVFLIAFFGCCGAWKENFCLLTLFVVFMSLIIIAEIAAAILAYIYKGKVEVVVQDSFADMISKYNTSSEEFRKGVDSLQHNLKCCGVNSSLDWRSAFPQGNTVPDSCCITETKGCGEGAMTDASKVYQEGCQKAVEKLLKDNVQWVIVAALVIALLQVMGVVFACMLMRGIRRGYEEVKTDQRCLSFHKALFFVFKMNTITFGTTTAPLEIASAGRDQPADEFDDKGNSLSFSYHLIKCRKNHPKLANELKTCPYNARHLVHKHELKHHTEICEDRINVDTVDDAVPNGEGSNHWQVPVSTWVNPNLNEDWDEEAEDRVVPFVWGENTAVNARREMRPTNNLGPRCRAPNTLPWSNFKP